MVLEAVRVDGFFADFFIKFQAASANSLVIALAALRKKIN
jgi:hypothetical protein